MGVQQRVYRPVDFQFPKDFPERLKLFKEASGLSWKSLARLLGVRPYRLWQWREMGGAPSPAHLFLLLTIAESMGLRDGILMCPDRDMPASRGPGGSPAMKRLTVISLGGGVQSSVMALMASAGAFDSVPACAIFADTHWEPPSLYPHLEWLAGQLRFPLYVVDNGRSLREDVKGSHQSLRLPPLRGLR